jgi:hypothetical protein
MLLRTLLSIVKNTNFNYFNSYYILYILYNLLILTYFKNLSISLRNLFLKKKYFIKCRNKGNPVTKLSLSETG